jgi:ABC-2 type transport system permease protein
MSLRNVGILLGKEFLQGPKGFIFLWAIVLPIVLSLVLSLIFGTLFSEKPKLGIMDEGGSQLTTMLGELDSVVYREYDSITEMKRAVENGTVDMGIVLPDGFDNAVSQGVETELTAYVWGESLAKDRIILAVAIADLVRELAGQEAPVEIESITLGEEEIIPWNDRLLPLIVIMAVFLGGVFLPATSIINEKEKKTIDALVVTPTSIEDIFLAKGLFGVILSIFIGIVVLLLNQAFGSQPLLLVLLLALGAVMAVEIGLICGAFFKDITTLFAVWKSGGILLFGPAIIYMFPQIPQWIGRIFPTYYLLEPIVTISQRGGGWPDIATNIFILTGIDIILIGGIILTLRKTRKLAG